MDKLHWQVPGNGNPFDSTLHEWEKNYMSQRSIGVLEYINSKDRVSKRTFENEIWGYLTSRFSHKPNNSNKAHFYRPLEFAGLIRNNRGILDLSVDGRHFLREVQNRNYDRAIDFYILQLMKVRYPNTATKDVILHLFPFRIMFKLFIDYEHIPTDYFIDRINYISNLEDIETLMTNHSSAYKKALENGNINVKWKSWVLSYLIKWNILELSEKKQEVYISIYKYDFIKQIVDNMNDEDMFFADEADEIFKKKAINHIIKRDNRLIKQVIEIGNNRCFLIKLHITFKTPYYDNYVEGHHIIPISLQDSYEEKLDSLDNLIPLCPICHRAMHLSENETKINLLTKILEKNDKLKTIKDIKLEDLKEIYCKEEI
ncbi:MAG: HNH endonuclease [Lachnospiraceae bacterium]|nr:HNH endonuclease [Lachnospiraceae bacterium]